MLTFARLNKNCVIICYLDPGAGSLIIQAVLAVLLGIGVFFKSIKYFFLGFIKKIFNRSDANNDTK
jgi:hypothetical protein